MSTFSTFDNEYFFIRSPADGCIPELSPDEDTVLKPYHTKALPSGQTPLIFHNGNLEMYPKARLKPVDPPPDVLFDGSDLVVRGYIAKNLEDMEIPNLAIQSTIYIDHKKKRHEDYRFLTFTKRFDCWDRKRSIYDPDTSGLDMGDNVYALVLNEELLQKTPLRERLLFKIGGATLSPVLAHQSIVSLFSVEGVDVISVADEAKTSSQWNEAES
ncbi:MAG: hypothetical protein LBQ75_09110 [Zoogloeaceae bacterium]|nr:hypothetical protein [Zoogloeaceae bacterium]